MDDSVLSDYLEKYMDLAVVMAAGSFAASYLI